MPNHAMKANEPGMLSPQAPMYVSISQLLYKPLAPLLGKIHRRYAGPRTFDAKDILLPEGYVAEVVATGMNDPVHCSFGPDGYCYVTECGHKSQAVPRVLKVDVESGEWETFFELPRERWEFTGAFTGGIWHEGAFYFMNTGSGRDALGTLSRLRDDGTIEDLVTGLPWGDHQPNYPVAGPDGKLYWGQGTATNTGVVSPDDYAYGFLKHHPDHHDVPGRDVRLAGRNYAYPDILGDERKTVRTGAYVPYGTETAPGDVIPGSTKATGAVLRCNPDGSDLELVAWGFRNPFGIGFAPDERLFVTEHGIDERGVRYIVNDVDDFYEVRAGEWYGWPDYASGIRLDDPIWGDRGRGREPMLAEPPRTDPPCPFVSFPPHVGSNGFDFCRDPRFGFEGDAFVALFGDLAPVTTREAAPSGFKVVRVDMKNRRVFDFALNRIEGPQSKLPHAGFERPSHCQFGPDGALYVVDWGEIDLAPERMNIREQLGTGALWRIRRTGERRGELPPKPEVVPLYGIAYALAGAAVLGLIATGGWLALRWMRDR